jgi:hypothetical protein
MEGQIGLGKELDGLRANRRAASRLALPRSTAPPILCRRSMDIGAGKMASRSSRPMSSDRPPIPGSRNVL